MKCFFIDSVSNQLIKTRIPDELYHPEYPLESLAAVDMYMARRMYNNDKTLIRTSTFLWAVKTTGGTIAATGRIDNVEFSIAFGPNIGRDHGFVVRAGDVIYINAWEVTNYIELLVNNDQTPG